VNDRGETLSSSGERKKKGGQGRKSHDQAGQNCMLESGTLLKDRYLNSQSEETLGRNMREDVLRVFDLATSHF
jgi:hypothetical protein